MTTYGCGGIARSSGRPGRPSGGPSPRARRRRGAWASAARSERPSRALILSLGSTLDASPRAATLYIAVKFLLDVHVGVHRPLTPHPVPRPPEQLRPAVRLVLRTSRSGRTRVVDLDVGGQFLLTLQLDDESHGGSAGLRGPHSRRFGRPHSPGGGLLPLEPGGIDRLLRWGPSPSSSTPSTGSGRRGRGTVSWPMNSKRSEASPIDLGRSSNGLLQRVHGLALHGRAAAPRRVQAHSELAHGPSSERPMNGSDEPAPSTWSTRSSEVRSLADARSHGGTGEAGTGCRPTRREGLLGQPHRRRLRPGHRGSARTTPPPKVGAVRTGASSTGDVDRHLSPRHPLDVSRPHRTSPFCGAESGTYGRRGVVDLGEEGLRGRHTVGSP